MIKKLIKKRLVYSTDQGRHCPTCCTAIADCTCNTSTPLQAGDGIVRLQRQLKGRNGKPVTLITGLTLPAEDLKILAKKLKQQCGVGGAIVDHNIIIQGDKRKVLQAELELQGFHVKVSGG